MSDDLLGDDFFAPESTDEIVPTAGTPWGVLIVDDEPAIHEVTSISLQGFEYKGRGLQLLHAYSAKEAQTLLTVSELPIAVALVDVVMETEHAGLDLVSWIRGELCDEAIRIVLRTGQPGQAPERSVITDYDINDYKAKTELTSQRLYTLMYTALRSYELIARLEANKRGMERVMTATRQILQHRGFVSFIDASLEQLSQLLGVRSAIFMRQSRLAVSCSEQGVEVLSCSGEFCGLLPQSPTLAELPFADLAKQAIAQKRSIFLEHEMLAYIDDADHHLLFYLGDIAEFGQLERELVQWFVDSVSVALHNLHHQLSITESQHAVIHRLTELLEGREHISGNHTRRISEGCALIARKANLSDGEIELIRLASPFYDIGKMTIPDDVLQKPGKLDEAEWAVMQTHAEQGFEILSSSPHQLLQAGADIARHHHEKWNGEGYPAGLVGEDIPIFARICAIVDVFDALMTERTYKSAWPVAKVIDYFRQERGKSFDPALVDILIAEQTAMKALIERFPDVAARQTPV